MRISDALIRAVVIGTALAAAPAFAFDGIKSTEAGAIAPLSPSEAFRFGTNLLKNGEKEKAVVSLQYAAEKGHPVAQWKLGRMYAEGDGVAQDDLKAFDYFRRVAAAHADDNPDGPQSRFVANAFVALGHYYLEGIPNTQVQRDAVRAQEMFYYAASYFRDPDAQYYLARMYLDGNGTQHDARLAARWFALAAHKEQCQAQAMLGAMLFQGNDVPRQGARGLMWLMLAKANAKAADQPWITKLHDAAVAQASDDERVMAVTLLKRYIENRRE